jgi:hypothetical protein
LKFNSTDGYQRKDIDFHWSKGTKSPITINSKLEMPDFILTNYSSYVCDRTTATGELFFYVKIILFNFVVVVGYRWICLIIIII